MPLLALDDTDTRSGGCTTRTALRLAAAIEAAGGALHDWGLQDAPRLVRLCPAVPWKTRGNGALVLPVGPRRGATTIVGHDGDQAIDVATPADATVESDVVEALRALVDRTLPAPAPDDADPQPAALLLPAPPVRALYARAVSSFVTVEEAWAAAPRGTIRLTKGPRRGEIGALAAAAWPMERYTWEYIAYRADGDTGPVRSLSDATRARLLAADSGFDNHDPETGRVRCVPRTPCPVLYGLRGTDPKGLLAAAQDADDGRVAGWLLRTNHASGDHARHAGAGARPWSVVRAEAVITETPTRGRGGHLLVSARSDDHDVRLAAFEPTRTLRDAMQALVPGDRVEVLARTGEEEDVWRLEAFRVEEAAPRPIGEASPRCPACTRAMKSAGRDAGYRCRPCGTRAPPHPRVAPAITGTFQVPDHVRGHLLPPQRGLQGGRPLGTEPPSLDMGPVFTPRLVAPA